MQMLGEVLKCMISQERNGKFSFDIIVVDDGSTDQTSETVAKAADKSQVPIRYFRTQGKGISHARNRGVAESCGEWIAFFDQDQLAEADWLEGLFDVASQTGADVVDGPRDLCLSKERLSQLGLACRRILGETGSGLIRHKRNERICSCTGNVLIRRGVFNVVGGFDESITRGGEDWEFFGRVKNTGFDIWHAPKALVHHVIQPERLTEVFFKWSSLRCGIVFADRDYRDWGMSRTTLVCILRIGKAILVNFPLLIGAYLMSNQAEILGQKCPLYRAFGYLRRNLSLLMPKLFIQENFFSRFELRKEKENIRASSVLTNRKKLK
jgi:glycosyltransferase involved in cell wall biosynthesis